MAYAAKTEVPVEKSKAEIEGTLSRYGASEFTSGWRAGEALIAFRVKTLLVRFLLPLPSPNEKRFTHYRDARSSFDKKRTPEAARREYDQEIRRRWRALLLVIKAKLEAVESNISTFEEEFMAHIVMPNDQTIGAFILDRALPFIREGKMPHAMLEGPKPNGPPPDVPEAEFEVKQ